MKLTPFLRIKKSFKIAELNLCVRSQMQCKGGLPVRWTPDKGLQTYCRYSHDVTLTTHSTVLRGSLCTHFTGNMYDLLLPVQLNP